MCLGFIKSQAHLVYDDFGLMEFLHFLGADWNSLPKILLTHLVNVSVIGFLADVSKDKNESNEDKPSDVHYFPRNFFLVL